MAGTAAIIAANGIVTKSQSAMRMPIGCLPVVRGFGAGPPGRRGLLEQGSGHGTSSGRELELATPTLP